MHIEDSGMSVIIIVMFFIQLVTLTSLYFTDRRLKRESKSGNKKVKMLTITKYKYFFMYYKRNEGVITKYAFVCMIAYYIVNLTLFTILTTQFFIDSSLSLTIPTATLCFLNIGLLYVSLG